MSESVSLKKIIKENNRVRYVFDYTDGLAKYFSGNPFIIDYSESIESVPNAVLAITFVVNVLPVIWLTNSILTLAELDKDFYESIAKIKKGYIDMFPKANWLGEIAVERVVDCAQGDASGSVAFFSGGLDATTTLLRHFTEKPELIVIWGADVRYDNDEGFSVMQKGLFDVATLYKLPLFVIHSAFRNFDKEGELTCDFYSVLEDNWWHGVKHGIGIIGHAVPLMWLHKRKTLYIASSFCAKDGNVRCASYPTIDEAVSFFGCNVVHDGFELDRQEKSGYVVKRSKELDIPVCLKVCWESQSGSNCNRCEKCYRTMVGFWVEGEDPKNYGFEYDENTVFDDIYNLIALKTPSPSRTWNHVKDRFLENWEALKDLPQGQKLAWIKDFDFENPESNPCRIEYRKKLNKGSWKGKLAKKFPWLRTLYRKIMRKK